MTAALTAIEGYEPAIIGAMVALIAWSVLQLSFTRSTRASTEARSKAAADSHHARGAGAISDNQSARD